MTKEDAGIWIQITVVLLFAVAVVTGFLMGIITAEAFLAIAGPAIGYYLSERKQSKAIEALKESNKIKLIDNPEYID